MVLRICSFCGESSKFPLDLIIGANGFICRDCTIKAAGMVEGFESEDPKRGKSQHILLRDPTLDAMTLNDFLLALEIDADTAGSQPFGEILNLYRDCRPSNAAAVEEKHPPTTPKEQAAIALANQHGIPAVTEETIPSFLLLDTVPLDLCEKHRIFPISVTESVFILAMVDPKNLHAMDDVEFLTGKKVEPVVATEEWIASAIAAYCSKLGF